ncbi:HNH endonuclease [Bordetella tumbae]|uniref:HNH endonuclease signature motif containing protein n=1 Tax=Bordetella tumbae TaxID=1649139 RepID=UPI0039EF089D
MTRKPWTDTEIKVLKRFYADMPGAAIAAALGRPISQVYGKARKLGLAKSESFYNGPHSGRLTDGTLGVSGRFQPGIVPWNKGKPGSAGLHPNSRRTQFKKGEMCGAARHNYVPIGTTRMSKDGYLEVKTNDDHPVPVRRWVAVHRVVWEAEHGPIPKGHIVCFKPGMRTSVLEEITVDRLECISQADNMRRNTLHNYPKEIVDVIRARAVLNRRINRVQKHQ